MDMDEIKQRVLEDVDPPSRKKKRKRIIRVMIQTLIEFISIIAVIFLAFQFIWGIGTVDGMSTYPTLHDGDRAVYYRLEKDIAKGDVVVLDRQEDGIFIKRVAAVAGDTVSIQDGSLYVNGRECVIESAAGKTIVPDSGIEYPLRLGDKEVFVIGDNRENSEDSRHFGAVKTEEIKGKVLFYFGKMDQ